MLLTTNSYIKVIYDQVAGQIFNSDFSVMATVFIKATEVGQESIYQSYGDSNDARDSYVRKPSYPEFLNPV